MRRTSPADPAIPGRKIPRTRRTARCPLKKSGNRDSPSFFPVLPGSLEPQPGKSRPSEASQRRYAHEPSRHVPGVRPMPHRDREMTHCRRNNEGNRHSPRYFGFLRRSCGETAASRAANASPRRMTSPPPARGLIRPSSTPRTGSGHRAQARAAAHLPPVTPCGKQTAACRNAAGMCG